MPAFLEGALAGYGIAIPVGAIAILIIDTGLRRGFRPAFYAAAGAASADFLYALLAALAGELISGYLAPFAVPLRYASALVLLAIGSSGLLRIRKLNRPTNTPNIEPLADSHTYAQFLGLTLLNPLTVAYFGALILGGVAASGTLDRSLFVLGAGLASLSWQILLAAAGALAKRHLSPRVQVITGVVGNLVVVGLGIRLMLV